MGPRLGSRSTRATGVALAFALAVTALPLRAQTPVYRAVRLEQFLPTQGAFGAALNDAGAVVGWGIETLDFQGVLWTAPDAFVDFNPTFGWQWSFGLGINDAGAWVGTAILEVTTHKDTAVVALPGEAPQFLPKLLEDPLIFSAAVDISDGGLIAGACDTIVTPGGSGLDPGRHAVLWDGGAPLDLGTLGGNLSEATALNDDALVVGYSNLVFGGLIRAFAWTDATGMVQLQGLHPDGRSLATDVNAHGLVVGDADGVQGRFPVTWSDPFAPPQALRKIAGDGLSGATAVNDHGQIVGNATAQPQDIRARLWQGGEVYDLSGLIDDPTLDLFDAKDINAHGVILGQAFDLTHEPILNTAVLLIPDLLWDTVSTGLAGTRGVPQLTGLGNLLPGGPVQLSVTDARANAPAFVLVGSVALELPFKGGTLVPAFAPPTGLTLGTVTDADGALALTATWPEGVPAGFELWYQAWIVDPAAPLGFASTPALRSTAP